METIVIAENKEKIRDILTQLLTREGNFTIVASKEEDVIRIVKKESAGHGSPLKEALIELENSLYLERKGVLYKSILDAVEKPIIERALERAEGNQLKAAKILGINRNTMRTKIKKLGISPGAYKQ